MAIRHMKRCCTSLIIREVQTKTIMKYHFTQVRMAIIQKSVTDMLEKSVEKREPISTVGGNVIWCSHCREQCEGSSKKQKLSYHMIQQSHFWAYIQIKLLI